MQFQQNIMVYEPLHQTMYYKRTMYCNLIVCKFNQTSTLIQTNNISSNSSFVFSIILLLLIQQVKVRPRDFYLAWKKNSQKQLIKQSLQISNVKMKRKLNFTIINEKFETTSRKIKNDDALPRLLHCSGAYKSREGSDTAPTGYWYHQRHPNWWRRPWQLGEAQRART